MCRACLGAHYGLSDYDERQGDDRTRALALPDEDEDLARQSAETQAGGTPVVVGVRLRSLIVVAVPVGEHEPGENA